MTEIEFSPEMIKQIEAISGKPEGTVKDPSIKFDGKGSLHLMYHDAEGKLQYDTKVETLKVGTTYKEELESDLRLSQETIVKQSKRLNTIFGVFIVLLLVLVILAIRMIPLLGAM